MDNALLHASGLSPADKMEEWVTLALCHAHLYLSESDDDQANNYVDENTFNISCGGGGSRSSL